VLKAASALTTTGDGVKSYFLPGLEVSASSMPADVLAGGFPRHRLSRPRLLRLCSSANIAGHEFLLVNPRVSVIKYIDEKSGRPSSAAPVPARV